MKCKSVQKSMFVTNSVKKHVDKGMKQFVRVYNEMKDKSDKVYNVYVCVCTIGRKSETYFKILRERKKEREVVCVRVCVCACMCIRQCVKVHV